MVLWFPGSSCLTLPGSLAQRALGSIDVVINMQGWPGPRTQQNGFKLTKSFLVHASWRERKKCERTGYILKILKITLPIYLRIIPE